jgi:predicted RNA-binding protein with PUA-like domain
MKSEPDVFSIDHLKELGQAPWDGVRNYQARNNMRQMHVGDKVLFYHSSTKTPGVAGVAQVCREAYPDFTAWDRKSEYFDAQSTPEKPRWMMVDVQFVEKFSHFVSLDELKNDPRFKGMVATKRGMRLSVQPVDGKDFQAVVKLASG